MEFDGVIDINSSQTPSLLGIPREKTFSIMGPLSVKTNVVRWSPPTNIELSSISYRAAVASSGDVIRWLLKKNNTVIAQGELSEGQYSDIDESLSGVTGTESDLFTVDITSVGTITSGAHLQLQLMYKTVE